MYFAPCSTAFEELNCWESIRGVLSAAKSLPRNSGRCSLTDHGCKIFVATDGVTCEASAAAAGGGTQGSHLQPDGPMPGFDRGTFMLFILSSNSVDLVVCFRRGNHPFKVFTSFPASKINHMFRSERLNALTRVS